MGPRLKLPPIAPCAGPKDVRKFLTSPRPEGHARIPPLKGKAAAKIVDSVVVFKHACAPACKRLSRSDSTDRIPLSRGISGKGLSLTNDWGLNRVAQRTNVIYSGINGLPPDRQARSIRWRVVPRSGFRLKLVAVQPKLLLDRLCP
jgi:hypothetical protein